jgi:tetratricopeptide (TPR) repeat protein
LTCGYLPVCQQAIRDCDKALSLSPNNSKAFFRKATALKALGKIDEALASLKEGLTHDPGNSAATADIKTLNDAKSKLATIRDLISNKRFQPALPQIDSLIGLLGNSCWELNIMKVEALLELKRTHEAYNLTNTLMRTISHADVPLLKLRTRCLYDMGDLENAVKHLQQALRADPDNTEIRVWYRKLKEIDDNKTRATNAYKIESYEEAITAWSQAISLDPSHHVVNAKLYCNCANGKIIFFFFFHISILIIFDVSICKIAAA